MPKLVRVHYSPPEIAQLWYGKNPDCCDASGRKLAVAAAVLSLHSHGAVGTAACKSSVLLQVLRSFVGLLL